MLDLRPILYICGIVLVAFGLVMAVPAIADLAAGSADWQAFAVSLLLTVFAGGLLILMNRVPHTKLNVRQAFVFTTLSWLICAFFGAIPFLIADLEMSLTDAFFESMSGITTTGSTVMTGLDDAPPGILLWRSLLQWMGGIGIIVVAVAIMPVLQVGGMQLFHMESSDKSDKVMPRAAQIAGAIAFTYLALSILCAVAYWLAGMSPFEAINHSMTTIATGGYSTSDGSVGVFNNPAIDWVGTAFMILGALPFVLYLQAVRGRPMALLSDGQVRWFLAIVLIAATSMSVWLVERHGHDALTAMRLASFNVVSIITGTGYATTNYGLWGEYPTAAFFMFMFIGGCAGSTSCGIKIFRFQVLYTTARVQIKRLIQPNGVFIPYFNGRPIEESVSASVMGFFFLFAGAFALLTLCLAMLGLDFMTSISGAGSAIANVGPGLGPIIGPSGNFQPLPHLAKWMLSAGMLLGRLELFTVLVLFVPSFWRA